MAPLKDLHVLDLSLLLPGPLTTQILRDMGAKVTKVEPPSGGDWIQNWPPIVDGISAIYQALNRGKSIEAIDLKDPAGLERFESMVSESDVVVEGFRPGVLDRLGIGYSRLSELNPGIVLCSISGFGQTGPYRLRAGHDIGYQATAGALSLAGGDLPANPCLQVADTAAGAYASAMLILAALLERQQTGRGRHLDVSMSEQLLPMMTADYASASAWGQDLARDGQTLTGAAACYRVYRTSDGAHIALGSLEPKFWRAVVQRLGLPELENAPYLGGPGSQELKEQLAHLFASKSRDEWHAIFQNADVCLEPVLSLQEVVRHPHWKARGSFTQLKTTSDKTLNVPKMPASLAGFDTQENRE